MNRDHEKPLTLKERWKKFVTGFLLIAAVISGAKPNQAVQPKPAPVVTGHHPPVDQLQKPNLEAVFSEKALASHIEDEPMLVEMGESIDSENSEQVTIVVTFPTGTAVDLSVHIEQGGKANMVSQTSNNELTKLIITTLLPSLPTILIEIAKYKIEKKKEEKRKNEKVDLVIIEWRKSRKFFLPDPPDRQLFSIPPDSLENFISAITAGVQSGFSPRFYSSMAPKQKSSQE